MVNDVAAQSNVITNIGAGRFKLRSIYVRQEKQTAPAMYLQIFNKANGIPGTDVPDEVIFLPAVTSPFAPMVKRIKISGSNPYCVFDTGLSFAVCTSPTNGTDVGSTKRPFVRIDYDGSTKGGAF
jgi:hypothetical protein